MWPIPRVPLRKVSIKTRRSSPAEDLRDQTVDDLLRTASDFTRKQPALVFGLASLAGFLAFRVLKSSTPRPSWEQEWEHDSRTRRFEGRAGQFHGA